MHEFSIAEALLERVDEHCPPGAVTRRVAVTAGAMQMIEPAALQTAWAVLTRGTRHDGATLDLAVNPPHRRCTACQREWIGGEMIELCTCGSARPQWIDAMLLQLMSLEVDTEPAIDDSRIADNTPANPAAPSAQNRGRHGHPRC